MCEYGEIIIENNHGIKCSVYRGRKLTYPVRNEHENQWNPLSKI